MPFWAGFVRSCESKLWIKDDSEVGLAVRTLPTHDKRDKLIEKSTFFYKEKRRNEEKIKKFYHFFEIGLTNGCVCGIIIDADREGANSPQDKAKLAGVAEQADARDLKSRDT